MLSRRTMLRAFGIGAPAAAVAAAVGLPDLPPALSAPSPESQSGFWLFDGEGDPVISTHEGRLVFHTLAEMDVAELSSICGDFGTITVGSLA